MKVDNFIDNLNKLLKISTIKAALTFPSRV